MHFRRLVFPFALSVFLILVAQSATVHAAAAAYVVMDSESGHVLSSANPEKRLQIGSLTKVATAMVVLDWARATNADLSQMATVSAAGAALPGDNAIGLQAGDRVTLRELLYAALMQSDNIAALTLAEHVGQALPASAGGPASATDLFVAQMNALARRLGAGPKTTMFLNPDGLDDGERKPPFSTALDQARIAGYAMDQSSFRFYVSQKERQITIEKATGGQQKYLLRSTNELLGVQDIDGVKTGTTRRAGQCLILSAAKPPESIQEGAQYRITPRRLIVVVLNSSDRFGEGAALLDRGWAEHARWVASGRPSGKSRKK